MGRLLKYLFRLAVLAAIALAAYAFFADLKPPTREIVVDLPKPETDGQ